MLQVVVHEFLFVEAGIVAPVFPEWLFQASRSIETDNKNPGLEWRAATDKRPQSGIGRDQLLQLLAKLL
jgi:hypothetical protein